MTTLRPIETLTNEALDQLAVHQDLQKPLRFKFRMLSSLCSSVFTKDWIMKGVLAFGETSAWIGPPGCLKSALLCELSFAVAARQDWHGHKFKQGGAVVFFALERADLVERRLLACGARHDAPVGPIAVVSSMVDLMRDATVSDVVATIRSVEQEAGERVALVVFDTFAKLIAASGGDENQAKDQGRVFANLQRIKKAIGCHIALIGHTGKDETRGARGSNAILGDVDLMVALSGDAIKTATTIKSNDMPVGPLFSFKSEPHEFGVDDDGDPVSVHVVVGVDIAVAKSREPKLSANQQTFFRILHDAGGNGLTVEEWNSQARQAGLAVTRKATLFDLRKTLQDRKLVREHGGRWRVNHADA